MISRSVSRTLLSSSTIRTAPCAVVSSRVMPLFCNFGLSRQQDPKSRPGAEGALDRDRPVHGLDDLPRDPEAQPEAAVVLLGDRPLELPEDARLVLCRDTDPLVPHDDEGFAALVADLDLDRLSVAV